MDIIQALELASNIVIIPLLTTLWSLQGRLSRIEGHLRLMERMISRGDTNL